MEVQIIIKEPGIARIVRLRDAPAIQAMLECLASVASADGERRSPPPATSPNARRSLAEGR